MSSLGLELKIKRIKADVTQFELSQVCGVPNYILSRYERGSMVPTEAKLKEIEAALRKLSGERQT